MDTDQDHELEISLRTRRLAAYGLEALEIPVREVVAGDILPDLGLTVSNNWKIGVEGNRALPPMCRLRFEQYRTSMTELMLPPRLLIRVHRKIQTPAKEN